MANDAIFDIVANDNGSYRLRLAPQDVTGHGGAEAPALIFFPKLFLESRDGHTKTQLFGSDIQALGVSIYKPNDFYPMLTSGLQYFTCDGHDRFCMLPVPLILIDFIRQATQITISFDAWLSPNLAVNGKHIIRTDRRAILMDQSHWYTNVLPQLGYPETRLVPLAFSLPSPIPHNNPEANKAWEKTVKQLSDCIDVFRSWHFEPKDLVKNLRPVAEHTLSTWLKLWDLQVPSNGKADAMLQALNKVISPSSVVQDIKPCNAPNGIVPVSAPHKRLCIALTMLHDLLQLSNVESHGYSQGIYTVAQAESLLYMTVGVIRSLPEIWEQYPSSPINCP